MNWYDLFGDDTNKEVTPGSVLPTQPTPVPYNNSADKYSALINHYNELAKAQPQQDTGVDWGKIIAQATAGYGNAIALGAGAQAPNNVQAIGDSFDKIRQSRYQNALDAWKTQLGVAQNEAGLYKDQAAIDAAKLKAEREQKTAEAQAKMYGARGDLATAQAEQVGKLTPYQKQRLDIEQNRLYEANRHNTTMEGIGRDKVTNANGGTVSPEPGLGKKGNEKLDEMRAKFISEKPAVEQYINQTAAALAKGGMIDQLEQSGEIGGGFLGWRNIVTGLDDKSVVKGLYRSRMSPTQRKMDAMLRGAAAQIARANNPTGTVTDADFTAAMKQVMSLGDDPGNVRDFIKQGHDAAQRRYNLLAPNDKSVQNENPNFVIGTVNGVRYKFDPVTKQNLGRAD